MKMENALRNITKRIDAISEFTGMTVRWLAVAMIAVMIFEVVMRYGFNRPNIWVHQTTTMLWGFYIVLGACYVLRHNAHVNLDLLYRKLTLRKQAITDSITYSLFFVYVLVILGYSIPWALRSIAILEVSREVWPAPIWLVKGIIPISVFLLLLQGISRYIRSIYAAISGKELDAWR